MEFRIVTIAKHTKDERKNVFRDTKSARLPEWLCQNSPGHQGGLSLKSVRITRLGIAVSISFALASCTTIQAQLAANPKQVPKVNLCRTYLQTPDPMFQQQLMTELAQRGISPFECHEMVQKQDQAAAALVAVALVGAAVAVCANGCTSGNTYYRPPPANSGNCQNPWDLDARGYRCGDRAASVRPGGYDGGYFPVAPAAFPAAPAISRPARRSRPTVPTSEVREVAAITLMVVAIRPMLTEACANQTHQYA